MAVEAEIISPVGELHLIAAADIAAGVHIVQYGTTAVVINAKNDITAGDKYTAHRGLGVKLPAATALTGVEADAVDWDDTNNEVVGTGTGDFALGRLMQAKTAGETSAVVMLPSD